MSLKSKFSIKKVIKVLSLQSENYQPARYYVWKVSGPNKFTKYFTTRKDAQTFINNFTSRQITK
jgi:hypothetical protein